MVPQMDLKMILVIIQAPAVHGCIGFGVSGYLTSKMESQMEKSMEHEMQTGVI